MGDETSRAIMRAAALREAADVCNAVSDRFRKTLRAIPESGLDHHESAAHGADVAAVRLRFMADDIEIKAGVR